MQSHILLIDDNEATRTLLATFFEHAGYRVTQAEDGEEALTLLPVHHFDVVVSDILMRGVSGIEVLYATRELEQPPAMILMTGYGSLETALMALRASAYDYVIKPCNPQQLLERVASAITFQASLHTHFPDKVDKTS